MKREKMKAWCVPQYKAPWQSMSVELCSKFPECSMKEFRTWRRDCSWRVFRKKKPDRRRAQ